VFTINGVTDVQGFLATGTVPDFGWNDAAGGDQVLPIAYLSARCEGAVMHGRQAFLRAPLPLAGDEGSGQAILNVADYTAAIRDAGNRVTFDFGGAEFLTTVVGVYEELAPQ
jgi:hypothetical protein